MGNPFTLPTLTMLTVVGAGAGLFLGNSALSEIDPVYFSSPVRESSFHADLVPGHPSWDAAAGAPVQNAAFASGFGTGCVNCRTYPEEYLPVPDSDFEARIASYDSPARPDDYADVSATAPESADFDNASSNIDRYTRFAVSADDQPAAVVQSAAAPAPATDCAVAEQCAGDPTPGI